MAKPTQPDTEFSKRYRKTSRYAFYMQNDPEETFVTVDPSRYITLDVNPQSISMREPIATAIQFTQGGGKIRESRGGLVKVFSIAGTTGYTPLPTGASLHTDLPKWVANNRPVRGSLVPRDIESLDETLGSRSGFFAFHRVRYLFRLYMYELRQGNTKVTLHYVDTKNDEYWRIEPQEFVMQRSSRKPFSYDYNISFQALEESSFGDLGQAFTGLPVEDLSRGPGIVQNLQSTRNGSGVTQTLKRFADMTTAGLNYLKHCSGVVQTSFQSALRRVNAVVSYIENIHSTALIVAETWHTLLAQLDNTLAGVFNTISLYAPDNIEREIHEWCLETQWLNDHLRAYVVASESPAKQIIDRINGAFKTGRLKQGSTTDLLTESSDSAGTPDTNPFIGRSGLQLVTNIQQLVATRQLKSQMIYQGDTIQSIALRVFGNVQRFIDLVLLNNLEAPYIVSDVSNKPANTLAWGEYIQVPADVSNTTIDQSDAGLIPTIASTVTRTSIPTELVDEDLELDWRPDQWIGYTVTLTHAGTEYTRVIVGNTENTLTVNFAWSPTPDVDDTYVIQMVLFDINRPLTPEAKAYGTDLLLKFSPTTGVSQNPRCDLVLDSSGGLARVRGVDNLIQALMLRLNTEQKRHPFHPSFGAQVPIGQAWNDDTRFLYIFFTRKSLLLDPRVQAVRNSRMEMQGGTVSFYADVQPINTRNTRQISNAVR